MGSAWQSLPRRRPLGSFWKEPSCRSWADLGQIPVLTTDLGQTPCPLTDSSSVKWGKPVSTQKQTDVHRTAHAWEAQACGCSVHGALWWVTVVAVAEGHPSTTSEARAARHHHSPSPQGNPVHPVLSHCTPSGPSKCMCSSAPLRLSRAAIRDSEAHFVPVQTQSRELNREPLLPCRWGAPSLSGRSGR